MNLTARSRTFMVSRSHSNQKRIRCEPLRYSASASPSQSIEDQSPVCCQSVHSDHRPESRQPVLRHVARHWPQRRHDQLKGCPAPPDWHQRRRLNPKSCSSILRHTAGRNDLRHNGCHTIGWNSEAHSTGRGVKFRVNGRQGGNADQMDAIPNVVVRRGTRPGIPDAVGKNWEGDSWIVVLTRSVNTKGTSTTAALRQLNERLAV